MSYDKKDIAVGSWPYNVQITFDGHFALTANQGNNGVGDGGVGSISVIDLTANPPRLVDYVAVDPLPEGLGVNPTAPLAVAVAINGSGTAPKGAWFEHPYSLLDVLSTSGGHVRKVGAVKAGRLPEGIAFVRKASTFMSAISPTATCRSSRSTATRCATPARR